MPKTAILNFLRRYSNCPLSLHARPHKESYPSGCSWSVQ